VVDALKAQGFGILTEIDVQKITSPSRSGKKRSPDPTEPQEPAATGANGLAARARVPSP
jgi:hypothetical protein